jgi:hypothetical protein
VVLDKLKQQPSATEQRLGRLLSSPPLDWDSLSARRSIRKAVNESADKKTKKLLSKLTNELLRVRDSFHCILYRSKRETFTPSLVSRSQVQRTSSLAASSMRFRKHAST